MLAEPADKLAVADKPRTQQPRAEKRIVTIGGGFAGIRRGARSQACRRRGRPDRSAQSLHISAATLTYRKENTTFSGIRQSISHGFPDPLCAFSEACHEELTPY
jgi:hypothetical protein